MWTSSISRRFRCPSGGGGNGITYVTNKQLAFGSTYMPDQRARCSKSASAGRTRSAARTRRRWASSSALDAYGITGLPTDARVAGGLPTQIITGFADLGRQATNPAVAVPDGVQSEGQLHAACSARIRSRPATSSSTSRPRCRTSTRCTAATPTRQLHAAGRHRRQQHLQPRRLHARPAQPVRAQQHPHRQPPAEHALRISCRTISGSTTV